MTRQASVGIVGFGNVGRQLAQRLAAGVVPELRLAALSSRDLDKAANVASELGLNVPVLSLEDLVSRCDIVVECATAGAVQDIAETVLGQGRTLFCVSAGGLADYERFAELARRNGGQIRIANGALPALDMVRAISEEDVDSIHLNSVIRPESLFKEPYAIDAGLDFEKEFPSKRTFVFKGTARSAASNFPRHMNIAVALAIAGIGLDRTTIELWVDPSVPGAHTTLEVKSEVASVVTTIQNIPSKANKKTSAIVVPSIVAALRSLHNPIVVGG